MPKKTELILRSSRFLQLANRASLTHGCAQVLSSVVYTTPYGSSRNDRREWTAWTGGATVQQHAAALTVTSTRAGKFRIECLYLHKFPNDMCPLPVGDALIPSIRTIHIRFV